MTRCNTFLRFVLLCAYTDYYDHCDYYDDGNFFRNFLFIPLSTAVMVFTIMIINERLAFTVLSSFLFFAMTRARDTHPFTSPPLSLPPPLPLPSISPLPLHYGHTLDPPTPTNRCLSHTTAPMHRDVSLAESVYSCFRHSMLFILEEAVY